MSPIQEFYANQTIFVTGVTGFLGKLTIEKLCRTCPDVKKIYVLVRSKREKTREQRLSDIFASCCFDTVKKERPDFSTKIQILSGDCSEPVLGLNENSLEIIKNEVNIVIHVAANVRFDTDLKAAVYTNVRSVSDILTFAKEMKQLKALVYVSTAFSHCYRSEIREEFYEVDEKPEKVVEMVGAIDEKILGVATPHILGKWPNTYCYTKALSEDLIRSNKQSLPVTIIRPAIVVSSVQEPFPGWIDSFNGIVGIAVGVALGVLRSLHVNIKSTAPVVPVDYVVNTILAAAWDVSNSKTDKTDTIPIYNFAPDRNNVVTWGWTMEYLKSFTFAYAPSKAVWLPRLQMSRFELVHKARVFLYHTLFAYMVDSVLFVVGKRPLAVEKYRKINKMIGLVSFFSIRSFNFDNSNVTKLWERLVKEDKELFKFDMRQLDWKKYYESCLIGGRTILLNDPLETVGAARRKMQFLAVVHYVFLLLVLYFWYRLFRVFY